MVRFYTLPPWDVDYPYILVNNQHPEYGLRYLVHYNKHKVVKAVIIDSGVEIFKNPRVRDYPGGYKVHIRRQVTLYDKLRGLLKGREILVTVPDYPDDYHHQSLWLSKDYTNIERTIDSIMYAIDNYPDIPWLIPLQGHNKRPRSLLRMLSGLEERGFDFKKYRAYAIANLCVERRCDIMDFSVKYVYYWFLHNQGYKPWIHIFGPKLNCVKNVLSYIDSFDSMAWTRPVELGLHKNYPWSAKNGYERKLFFQTYLKRLKELGIEVE